MPRFVVRSYLDCTRCPLCKFRMNIVFGRGTIPAKILFIGEAPGKTEDLLATPFVGAAGKLLDKAILKAQVLSGEEIPTYFITNVLACRPTDKPNGDNRPPTPAEAFACHQRVRETYKLISPRIVVCLGEVAKEHTKKLFNSVHLRHPTYILRKGGTESPEFLAIARDLAEVFKRANR